MKYFGDPVYVCPRCGASDETAPKYQTNWSAKVRWDEEDPLLTHVELICHHCGEIYDLYSPHLRRSHLSLAYRLAYALRDIGDEAAGLREKLQEAESEASDHTVRAMLEVVVEFAAARLERVADTIRGTLAANTPRSVARRWDE